MQWWPLVRLALVLLAVGAALAAGVCVIMALMLLRPQRMMGGRALWILRRLTPGDLGLQWEDPHFVVRGEHSAGEKPLRLNAWWIPAETNLGRCILIIHGYADSKIGGIAWAPTFRAMGWNVLAIDLRAHGESEGHFSTAGYYERHDLNQVIDQLRQRWPAQTRQLVLFGVSLGAAVASAAVEQRPTGDVTAVIMDCPYASFPDAARTHAGVLGMPGPMFQHVAIALAQRFSGADFLQVAPERLIPRLACPLMVIHGADDLFVTTADMDRVQAAVQQRSAQLGPTVYWRCQNTHHVLALRSCPDQFRQRVGQFLEQAIQWSENAKMPVQE